MLAEGEHVEELQNRFATADLLPMLGVQPFRGRFYTPQEFEFLKLEALRMGFRHVESGPLVRSSYHAHEQADSVTA